jgi:hypothetical protein
MRSLVRIVLGTLGIVAAGTAAAADGPRDNTAIYSTLAQALTAEQIQELAPDAVVQTASDKIIVSLPGVTLTISSMRGDSLVRHLNGFSGYIQHIGGDSPSTRSLLKQLQKTTASYGVVIEPSFDSGGRAKAIIMALAKKHEGLMFAYSSIYSPDGKKQLGQPDDPSSYDAP